MERVLVEGIKRYKQFPAEKIAATEGFCSKKWYNTLEDKMLKQLITYSEYTSQRTHAKNAKEVCKLYGNRCPSAYASVIENIQFLSPDLLVYHGLEFSKDMFKERPSYSYWASKTGVGRSTLSYIGNLLGVTVSKSESLVFNCRSRKPALSSEQRQLMLGSLLGDGAIDKSYQFVLSQSIKHEGYLRWFYNRCKNICPSTPKPQLNRGYRGFRLSTYVLNETENLRNTFYPEGKKIVPGLIDELDAQGLAVWYMEDGGTAWHNTKSGYRPVARIFTLGFDQEDHNRMVAYFDTKWGICARIAPHKMGKKMFLRFGVKDSLKLFGVIKPFIHSDFTYKVQK